MAAKRLFPIVLALLMGVSFATPRGARATEFEADGLRYATDDITVDSSPLTIARVLGCVGTCPDDLVIPDALGGNPVYTISDAAFISSGIKTVVIGNSVKYILDMAFRDTLLSSVSIPNSVEYIGPAAFAGSLLSSVTLGNSVTYIAEGAFSGNSIAGALTLPNRLTGIGGQAFKDNLLTTVTIPDSVTVMDAEAFMSNRITNLTLSNSLTIIDRGTFRNNLISSLNIPSSVTAIGDYAFKDNFLTTVTIPSQVTHIGSEAFRNNPIVELAIPNSVTTIGSSAFAQTSMTTVTIPNSVTTIGNGAFQFGRLTSVVFGSGVTTIESDAFRYNSLTSVTIPASVTSIGDMAFLINSLTSATFLGNAPTAGAGVFGGNADLTSVTRFYSKTGWGATWSEKDVVIGIEATFKPSRSGTVAVGNKITANPGTWDGPATPTLAYQWYACTAAITVETQTVPSTCSAISSATQSTFTVTAAESDKFIAVGVTASSAGATPVTWLSATIAKAPPANTVAPVATETVTGISSFTATSGTWTGIPAPTVAFQWLRCTAAGTAANTLPSGCTTIAGANQATYATDALDHQKFLRVQVTATNELGSTTRYTAATANALALPANTVAPAVTGTTSVYANLTSSSGTWTGYPARTYTYQWLRCTAAGAAANTLPAGCTTIAGAIQATYAIDTPDYLKYLRVQVTATNTLGSATRYTAATAKIAGRITVNTVAPIISGTTTINATLTSATGTWTGAPVPTYTYQWLRCTRAGSASDALPSGCSTISGATRTTYKLSTTDYGKYLRLRIVGTNALGADTKYSAATAKIAGIDPVNTVAPRITGTPKVASTVTGTEGTWTGFPDPTSTYQWFRCTSAGSASTTEPSGCTAISGATRSTYKLAAADKTAGYLRVRVTGSSAEGRAVRFSGAVTVQ